MKLEYYDCESTVYPQGMEIVNGVMFIRRDIHREQKDIGLESPIEMWLYKEAKMTVDEFNANFNAMIMLEQQASAENNMVSLAANADLYFSIEQLTNAVNSLTSRVNQVDQRVINTAGILVTSIIANNNVDWLANISSSSNGEYFVTGRYGKFFSGAGLKLDRPRDTPNSVNKV